MKFHLNALLRPTVMAAVLLAAFLFALPAAAGEKGARPVQIAATDQGNKTDAPAPPDTAYPRPLQEAMEKIFKAIEEIDADPSLSLEEKQQKAMEFIRNFRYGPENEDYFWINNLQGVMLMHPENPNLVGRIITNMRDITGKLFFVDLLGMCLEKGAGFVNYMWAKPGMEKPVPKMSYAKLYKPWGWMVATGVYLVTIEAYDMPIEPGFLIPLPTIDDRFPASPV